MKRFCKLSLFLAVLINITVAIVWEADDAWIVDDLEDNEIEEGEATTSLPTTIIAGENNTCTSSNGVSGQCKPIRECYDYLYRETKDGEWIPSNENLTQSVESSADTCVPNSTPKEIGLGSQYICCTSALFVRGKPWTNFADDITVSETGEHNETQDATTRVSVTPLNTECGVLNYPQSTVVGGRPANLREFPWAVAIFENGRLMCGGSLINNKFILSAAHCLNKFQRSTVKYLRIHIGDYDYSQTGEIQHVAKSVLRIKYHKSYSPTYIQNDVALLELPTPVSFNSNIQPVCLASGNVAYDSGNINADVAGWGGQYAMGPSSSTLLTSRLRIYTNPQCSAAYQNSGGHPITANMVCAGSNGRDSCQGDSGGPLTINTRGKAQQVGIVSWGIGCGQYPGVYTRVDKYLSWIKKHAV